MPWVGGGQLKKGSSIQRYLCFYVLWTLFENDLRISEKERKFLKKERKFQKKSDTILFN